MATVNCFVTNILQNIFFCVQEKKVIQVCNNIRVSKWLALDATVKKD